MGKVGVIKSGGRKGEAGKGVPPLPPLSREPSKLKQRRRKKNGRPIRRGPKRVLPEVAAIKHDGHS